MITLYEKILQLAGISSHATIIISIGVSIAIVIGAIGAIVYYLAFLKKAATNDFHEVPDTLKQMLAIMEHQKSQHDEHSKILNDIRDNTLLLKDRIKR
jgi:hypothetical protein